MKSYKLPKTVYITRSNDDEGYLLCHETLEDAAESNGLKPMVVGTYTLSEQAVWKLVAQREE